MSLGVDLRVRSRSGRTFVPKPLEWVPRVADGVHKRQIFVHFLVRITILQIMVLVTCVSCDTNPCQWCQGGMPPTVITIIRRCVEIGLWISCS